jgi:DNA-binding Xre family transcriptional regulator
MTGDELKNLIENSGYNHTQVAELLGMSYQNLFRMYKREYIKTSQLNEIFNKLGINKKVDTEANVTQSKAGPYKPTPREADLEDHINTLKMTVRNLEKDKESLRKDKEFLQDILRSKMLNGDNGNSKAS